MCGCCCHSVAAVFGGCRCGRLVATPRWPHWEGFKRADLVQAARVFSAGLCKHLQRLGWLVIFLIFPVCQLTPPNTDIMMQLVCVARPAELRWLFQDVPPARAHRFLPKASVLTL